ncbi:MAG: SLC13 family permease [Solirubrobacteraceae bacterium]|jgi:arsenical pump membrane protein
MRISATLAQVWPAFVLVTGLLLVGLASHADGLFARAGRLLERLPGSTLALLLAGMLLVAAVTAVLNLDTAVVFLTPVVVLAARHRGVREEPFLFSVVFMANASSLFLPGSNLTNLLVLDRHPVSGGAFAGQMLAPALVAALLTAVGLVAIFRRQLHDRAGTSALASPGGQSGVGLVATLAAAALTLALSNPALPVLAVGVVAVAVQIARRRIEPAEITRALGPATLIALFALSVAVGVLARSWSGPARLLDGAGIWGTAAAGALASVAINNLPSAVLLSARPLAHPRALLVGLNLGPNLAVTGSLSAYLWFKAAAQLDIRPSLTAFTRRGIVLAPLAIVGALAAITLFRP